MGALLAECLLPLPFGTVLDHQHHIRYAEHEFGYSGYGDKNGWRGRTQFGYHHQSFREIQQTQNLVSSQKPIWTAAVGYRCQPPRL